LLGSVFSVPFIALTWLVGRQEAYAQPVIPAPRIYERLSIRKTTPKLE